jgi:hypothetical protein
MNLILRKKFRFYAAHAALSSPTRCGRSVDAVGNLGFWSLNHPVSHA